ncbi:MAG TPA: Hpt domain-containing protein [Terriglobales bacterium]|nr:Hpt domain-containing protein [Terriglobales bacterium]
MSSSEVAKKLNALWQTYLPTMVLRLAAIQLALETLEAGHLDRELARVAALEAHKLAGSLGTFGLASSSGMSSQIEHLLSQPDSAQNMAPELRKLFDSVKRDIEAR